MAPKIPTTTRRNGRSLHLRAALSSLTVATLAIAFGAAATTNAAGAAGGTRTIVRPSRLDVVNAAHGFPAPVSTAECQADLGINCYTPVQYRQAYDLNPLYQRGITGAGRTIVIVDSFGSPTIAADLHTFDTQFGFPDPVLQIEKFGNVPPFDPTNATMVGWAEETSLDVEYAHSVAPGATIVLAETPVAETEGVTGLPEMMTAEKTLIDQGVGDVISQSFGATENTFPGFAQGDYSSLLNLRYAFQDAAQHSVTVLASSGDDGATDPETDGETLYPYTVNSWPSSDPLVTSIGGTQLNLDQPGNKVTPDVVWNDGYGAGGGGQSAVFSRPLYQIGVARTVGGHRGTPDISMSAAVNGACWVYMSFAGVESPGVSDPGWYLIGGTSEAAPIFSGIVALADQKAGRRLGNINPALYTLGALTPFLHSATGLVDVTSGNNSFGGVTGFTAANGYDLASGWGTIDATKFVTALATLSHLVKAAQRHTDNGTKTPAG